MRTTNEAVRTWSRTSTEIRGGGVNGRLLAALERLVGMADLGEVDLEDDELAALEEARAAIAAAKGKP